MGNYMSHFLLSATNAIFNDSFGTFKYLRRGDHTMIILNLHISITVIMFSVNMNISWDTQLSVDPSQKLLKGLNIEPSTAWPSSPTTNNDRWMDV